MELIGVEHTRAGAFLARPLIDTAFLPLRSWNVGWLARDTAVMRSWRKEWFGLLRPYCSD